MIRSRPIEIDGRFLGVAVQQGGSWRFIATEAAARAAEEGLHADPEALRRQVRRALAESRLPVRRAG
ncbi:hypothetical protein [Roseomonas sp. KE0001]|uniref:hypothetical protein n=1 Tax=Roseomonas sp. KE0001 TaxID=2479201 RepID=UPI0018E004EE|nr:hypothetical protein [Roseomonas sp. KE0001]MBI0435227.1 hypothetical protein [Roseomonas sp. KE0001]